MSQSQFPGNREDFARLPVFFKVLVQAITEEYDANGEVTPRIAALLNNDLCICDVSHWMDNGPGLVTIENSMIWFARNGADHVALISESYGLATTPEHRESVEKYYASKRELHKHPDAQEIVHIIGETPTEGFLCLAPLKKPLTWNYDFIPTNDEQMRARFQGIFRKAKQKDGV